MNERADIADPYHNELRRHYRERMAIHKQLNEALHDLHWSLEELEQQISQLSAEQAASDAPHVARRVSDLRIWKSDLEERLLGKMIAIDDLAAQLALDRAELES
jgi:predicted nuclease with TOPRIM domain